MYTFCLASQFSPVDGVKRKCDAFYINIYLHKLKICPTQWPVILSLCTTGNFWHRGWQPNMMCRQSAVMEKWSCVMLSMYIIYVFYILYSSLQSSWKGSYYSHIERNKGPESLSNLPTVVASQWYIGIECRFCKMQGPCLPPSSLYTKELPCPVIGGQILCVFWTTWSFVPRTKNFSCGGSRRQRGRRLDLSLRITPEAAPLGGRELLLPLLPFWPCLQPSGSDPSTTNGSWIYGGSNINTTPAIRESPLCYPTSHQRSQAWGGMQPAFLACALCIKGLGKM